MSEMQDKLMEMLMEKMGKDGNNERARKAHEPMRNAAAKHDVKILLVVTDFGDFTNQWRNIDGTNERTKFLHARGIKQLALDSLASAPVGPSADAAPFHGALVEALAEFDAQPLYVLARYPSGIQAYLNAPTDAFDREIVLAGIKELVKEFLVDK